MDSPAYPAVSLPPIAAYHGGGEEHPVSLPPIAAYHGGWQEHSFSLPPIAAYHGGGQEHSFSLPPISANHGGGQEHSFSRPPIAAYHGGGQEHSASPPLIAAYHGGGQEHSFSPPPIAAYNGGGQEHSFSLPPIAAYHGGGEEHSFSLPPIAAYHGGGQEHSFPLPPIAVHHGGGQEHSVSLPRISPYYCGPPPSREDWKLSIPSGFRFSPSDQELIKDYLQKFLDPRAIIGYADIYECEPEELQAVDYGDGKMYFFTMIKKIGVLKTARSIKSKNGHWKATQGPKNIKDEFGNTIGFKIPLTFYRNMVKTPWLMTEYRLEPKSSNSQHSSDEHEIVLAVVYQRKRNNENQN